MHNLAALSKTMADVDSAVKEIVGGIEQIKSNSGELRDLSEKTEKIVHQFKVDKKNSTTQS